MVKLLNYRSVIDKNAKTNLTRQRWELCLCHLVVDTAEPEDEIHQSVRDATESCH